MNKIALASLLALLAAAAQATVIDDFRDAGKTWTPLDPKTPGTATVANGVLSLSSPVPLLVLHGIALPTATRYRAEVDITFRAVDPAAKASGAGLALRGALGDQLQVQLTSNGLVRADYTDGKTWGPLPIQYTRAGKARAALNATDRLAVERHDGYFRVFVNGEYVARTGVIDLSPREIGLLLFNDQPMTVAFDNVTMDAYGADSRFRRLLNINVTPGTHMMVWDDFARDKKDASYPDWGVRDNELFSARVENGEMLVAGKQQNTDDFVVATVATPPSGLGFQVGARLRHVAGATDYGRGLLVLGAKADGDTHWPYLALHTTHGHLRLQYRNGKGQNTDILPWTKTPTAGGDNQVTLVVENGRALAFIDGQFQGAAPLPAALLPRFAGLSVSGAQTVAFDNVYARDF